MNALHLVRHNEVVGFFLFIIFIIIFCIIISSAFGIQQSIASHTHIVYFQHKFLHIKHSFSFVKKTTFLRILNFVFLLCFLEFIRDIYCLFSDRWKLKILTTFWYKYHYWYAVSSHLIRLNLSLHLVFVVIYLYVFFHVYVKCVNIRQSKNRNT